jgi:hypothetical protein
VVLYAPGMPQPTVIEDPPEMQRTGTSAADYHRLILAGDRERFFEMYPLDIRPTSDDRPFFFHTTRLRDQFQVAFGRSMLFGNGLSALLSLMGISVAMVALFVVGPLIAGGERPRRGWAPWLGYFAALGAGFMLLEVALLQRFVLFLGHPVYSLTVTLFALLLGTGLGSFLSRHIAVNRTKAFALQAILGVVLMAVVSRWVLPAIIDLAIGWPIGIRIALAAVVLLPLGVLLGIPLPAGMRLVANSHREIIPWGWGMNGAFSVIGATLAVFVAMNWGFSATLLTAGGVYAGAAGLLASR